MELKYWLVGASWEGGTDPKDESFVDRGIWMLGWEEGTQSEKAKEIAPGDRIAIKRLLGKAQTGLRIMHIGIVRGVILETSKVICTVNWVATNLDRRIDASSGCFGSIHGPYAKSESPATKQWLEEIFSL